MGKMLRCIVCQRFYEVDYTNTTKRYCSNACKQRAYRIAENIRKPKEPRKPIELNDSCATCGQDFIAHSYRQIYCSKACKQAAYRERQREKVGV